MTIYLYSGTPGSGKSYHATADIWDYVNRRYPRAVVSNYDLRHDMRNYDVAYHYLPNGALDPDWLVDFSARWFASHKFQEDSILLVLDECQLLFNSREWNNPRRMAWLEFMSQHRHHGYKVILIAQSDKMVDRQFRALIEYEVKHRRLANFGIVGKVISLVALGRLFGAITTYYGLKERIGVRFFVPRRRVLGLYDSYQHFQRDGSAAPAELLPDPTG